MAAFDRPGPQPCNPDGVSTVRDQNDPGTQRARKDWRELTDSLPQPEDDLQRHDLLWQQLEAHFRWYDRGATRSRYGYQGLKILALVSGAAVTVLAAIGAPPGLTASLAAVVVVAEGVQQVFQFHANWISYRSTAETLRQHAFFFTAGIEPYDDPSTRRRVLAALLRDVTSKENAEWSAVMRNPAPSTGTDTP
jgi:hypothetical protein